MKSTWLSGALFDVPASSELLSLMLLGTGLIFLGVILLVLLRKMFRSDKKGGTADFQDDALFLDGLRSKLSPDEMRRVKKVVLRQMVEKEGLSPTRPDPQSTAPKPQPNPPPTQPDPQVPTVQPEKPQPKPVDIDTLLEKGLITEKEFRKLKEHLEKHDD